MNEHAGHLSGLAEQGTVIVFGLVADPKGPWGMAVIDVADEAAARKLTEQDPAIRAGIGLRYEILPMPRSAVGRVQPSSC